MTDEKKKEAGHPLPHVDPKRRDRFESDLENTPWESGSPPPVKKEK